MTDWIVPANGDTTNKLLKQNLDLIDPAIAAAIAALPTGDWPATGVIDGSDAASGIVGQYFLESTITPSSFVTLSSTATYKDSVTKIVPKGDWDLAVVGCHLLSTMTGTGKVAMAISAYSNNTTTDHQLGINVIEGPPPQTTSIHSWLTLPRFRVSLSANTTYYVKGYATFTGGTGGFAATLTGRRIR